jgi:lipid II:glycine glycyltransferase (peptidoglycan interpeptide bridge formation enzyme)
VYLESTELGELHNKDNLMQSRFWGRAKREAGKRPLAFTLHTQEGRTELLALLNTCSGGCYAYLPLAPDLWIPPQRRGLFLEELSRHLAELLPRDCLFIRYDLSWETPYEAGEEGEFDTADGRPAQHVRELRMNFGTRSRNLRKAPTDIQPADTLLLPLDRDDDALLSGMRSKTRYNIRLAARRGVQVRDAEAGELDCWFRLYRETAARKGITLHDQEHFRSLFRAFRRFHTPNLDLHLLLAEKDGAPLAGIIVALHGSTATYLYGATGSAGRSLMPSYRLQWEAIRLAKAQHCEVYDFFGIPPTSQPSHPMHGLYRFKRGFGGSRLHRQGCWDYPLHKEAYHRFAEMERTGGGYHL